MKQYPFFMIIVVVFVVVFTGCGDGDDDSTGPIVPTGSLDLTGTYRFQSTITPTSGDCSDVPNTLSGTMTFAHTSATTFTVTSCTYDSGDVCFPIGYTGTIQDSQVTLSQDLILGDIEYHTTVTGTVTDPSNFSWSGQGTYEPGACQFDITGTLSKI